MCRCRGEQSVVVKLGMVCPRDVCGVAAGGTGC